MNPPTQPHAAQLTRLKQFNCDKSVDMHCHVLPGIDDGPPTLPDALALCAMLAADGITDVIATPHQLGRWDGVNRSDEIRKATLALQADVDAAGIPIRIHVGGEVRLDERIPLLLQQDRILTVGDRKRHLLLELPSTLTIDPAVLVGFLSASGTRIILAHPERYDALQSKPELAETWTSQGVLLQVNAMSLLGDAGEHAENVAWEWLRRGLVALVATDAHGVSSRRPKMTQAIDEISSRCGRDRAQRMCIDNPRRLLDGAELT